MILYSLLRGVAGIALRWYYRDIEVEGLDHLSAHTPTILLANHPNALVDALVIGCTTPTRIQLTAKGTFFSHPVLGPFFRSIGIIPLHRARDHSGVAPPAAGDRNTDAFRAILDSLEARRVVLIFPEGTTHSGPELVPLKSGAARLALAARNDRDIRGLQLIAVGLVFESKSRPRSRVLVQFGEPLSVDRWSAEAGEGHSAVHALTAAIDKRLRAVTLNFPTSQDAAGVRRIARLLSDALDPPRPVAAPYKRLADEFEVIRRVDAVRRIMASAGLEETAHSQVTLGAHPEGSREAPSGVAQQAALAARAQALLARIDAFDRQTTALGLAVNDVDISLSTVLGTRFALREGGIAVATAPLAWWGRFNHWLPFRVAGAMGRRPGLDPEEPAMHTIAWGAALVLLAYSIQAGIVAWLFGGWWAALYLVSLPPSASWDLRYRDRLSRAVSRMQAYRRFRRNRALQQHLASELHYLRTEAATIGQLAGPPEGTTEVATDERSGAEPVPVANGERGVAGSGRPGPSATHHVARRSEDP